VTAWLKLLRLPNVFTAVADVMMGFLLKFKDLQSFGKFIPLVITSCLLYLSGMVLNDVFDAEVDSQERPDRPIPSGRISRTSAAILGWGLFAAGVAVAWFASMKFNDWRPGGLASVLASCIVLYDGGLKHTRLAPVVMGECRMLNVLLGMSLILDSWGKFEVVIALGVAVYIAGVTMFARTEARISSRARLSSGLVVLLSGLAVLMTLPYITNERPPLEITRTGWYLLWAAIILIIARRCLMAIFDPSPRRVQLAVRNCVHSVIVIDAAVCVGYVGQFWGFAVLALLIPTMLLTLWLNAT
jgi:4-hydroxybenzoate polyprenyltransferase